MVKPVWNNAQRVNHQNFAKKTHPCAKKNLVPRAVLMKSGLVSINTARQNISKIAVSVNTARQVNTAHSKTTVNAARPMSYLSKTAHSTVKRPIHKNTTFKNSNIDQRVNTVSDKKFNIARPKAVVNAVKGNNVNAVKASACWVWKPKTKVLDHMEDMLLLEGIPKEGKSQENVPLKLDSYKDGDGDTSFQLKSDSLPHAHAQTTKTYYKHQDSRIKKAQDLKTKTSANSDIQDLPSRYQDYQDNDCQGRLLASFQDDAKYEHVGQDTRSQGNKDDQD
ncbi:hypothetical protein Tco_0989203 [Tanacetum coccineum]|uniref:Uncharacterized protein n=1 Tax=Tanacetum coccineum TaxID=301880 RepID=A0ABQ5ETG2_9ASTR